MIDKVVRRSGSTAGSACILGAGGVIASGFAAASIVIGGGSGGGSIGRQDVGREGKVERVALHVLVELLLELGLPPGLLLGPCRPQRILRHSIDALPRH